MYRFLYFGRSFAGRRSAVFFLEDFPLESFPRLTHSGTASFGSRHRVVNHCHFGCEFVYVQSGSAELVLDEAAAPQWITKEDLIVTAPLIEHTFRLEPSLFEMRWIGFQAGERVARARSSMFSGALARSGFRNAGSLGLRYFGEGSDPLLEGLVTGIPISDHLVMHRMPEAGEIIGRIQREIRENLALADRFILIKVLELFAVIKRRLALPAKGFAPSVSDQIESFLRLNYALPLALGDLGRISGYNPAYLCRKFREEKGLSPMAYLSEYRIRRAEEMLLAGRGVAETASLCGYSDASYFSDCFKRKTGVSPKAYAATSGPSCSS
jgi:AraC-like DNA-binding protein